MEGRGKGEYKRDRDIIRKEEREEGGGESRVEGTREGKIQAGCRREREKARAYNTA